MIMDRLEELLIELEIVCEKGIILPEENLLEQYLIDSFKFIELFVKLEESFMIEFDDEDILVENFGSLNRIAELIGKYQ